MKISCPSCQTMFALDDKRVPPSGLSIKCPKCSQPFSVAHPPPGEESKVVVGVPRTSPGVPRTSPGVARAAVQDTVVEQTIIEKQAPGERSDTLIDTRANLEAKKGSP